MHQIFFFWKGPQTICDCRNFKGEEQTESDFDLFWSIQVTMT